MSKWHHSRTQEAYARYQETALEPLPQAILRAAKRLTRIQDILAKSRKRPIARARQAMMLATKLAEERYSFHVIAMLAGGLDHTSAIHGCKAAMANPEQQALARRILEAARADLAQPMTTSLHLSLHIKRLDRARKRQTRTARAEARHAAFKAEAEAAAARARERERREDAGRGRYRPLWERDTEKGKRVAALRARHQYGRHSGPDEQLRQIGRD